MSGPSSRLTRYQQQQVFELSRKNVSIRKTAELLQVNRGAVWRLLTKQATAAKTEPIATTSTTDLYSKFIGLSWLDFWSALGPPLNKNGEPTECWPYELNLIDDLELHRRIAVNKARGVGLTELALRYVLYLCLARQQRGNYLVVCGNTFEIARSLMRRLKAMLIPHSIYTDDRETVLTLPGCRIQAYSSEVNSFRSLTDIRFILADEVDSLDNSQDIRAVLDAYAVKSNAQIVLCSTPGQIDSTMHRLFQEPEPCLYKRITLPYTVAVDKLYSKEEIEHLKLTSPSFNREFCCLWGYVVSGSFLPSMIDRCILPTTPTTNDITSICGIDIGWSSSKTAISIVAEVDDKLVVLYCEEFDKAVPEDIIQTVLDLQDRYHVDKTYVDGANPSFIRTLLLAMHQDSDYPSVIKRARDAKIDPELWLSVVPVNFGTLHKVMLSTLKYVISDNLLTIPSNNTKLIQQLYACQDAENSLIKSGSNLMDSVDSLRIALRGFDIG